MFFTRRHQGSRLPLLLADVKSERRYRHSKTKKWHCRGSPGRRRETACHGYWTQRKRMSFIKPHMEVSMRASKFGCRYFRIWESGDDEYKSDQSDSEDEVDSDFDIVEEEEPESGQEEDFLPRKKRRVVTKAYKEPMKASKPKVKVKKPPQEYEESTQSPEDNRRECFDFNINSSVSSGIEEIVVIAACDIADVLRSQRNAHIPRSKRRFCVLCSAARTGLRHSTAECTRQTYLRLKEREELPKRQRKKLYEENGYLTQEQLLAEARVTEEMNLRSLENYERLEADKKKQVLKKKRCTGPMIRYHSLSMPLVTEVSVKEENVDVEGLDAELEMHPGNSSSMTGRCSRNFITFSDDETFLKYFPVQKSVRVPIRDLCPVTHKPALYRDPITDIPYASPRAFKIIREAYRTYIATHGMPGSTSSSTSTTTMTSGATQAGEGGTRPKGKISSK
uniref:Vacuolar protein sorting-associated protein 72 homolog n=1 Tax=Eptatretus burgeri TaxID=7764 RepID=A0A8C4QV54_EPTBU